MKCICGKPLASGYFCSRSCLELIKEQQAQEQNDAVRYTVEPSDPGRHPVRRVVHTFDEEQYQLPLRLDPG